VDGEASETAEIPKADAYQRATDATVLEAFEDGALLDRTVFYARIGQDGEQGQGLQTDADPGAV